MAEGSRYVGNLTFKVINNSLPLVPKNSHNLDVGTAVMRQNRGST